MTPGNSSVLDASAILALLFREPGIENLPSSILNSAVASAVNIAEVQTRLVKQGQLPDDAWQDALFFVQNVEAFTPQPAKIAGTLATQAKPFGLSLGDRACLALALERNAPVYTTDKVWAKLQLGIQIHIIR